MRLYKFIITDIYPEPCVGIYDYEFEKPGKEKIYTDNAYNWVLTVPKLDEFSIGLLPSDGKHSGTSIKRLIPVSTAISLGILKREELEEIEEAPKAKNSVNDKLDQAIKLLIELKAMLEKQE